MMYLQIYISEILNLCVILCILNATHDHLIHNAHSVINIVFADMLQIGIRCRRMKVRDSESITLLPINEETE